MLARLREQPAAVRAFIRTALNGRRFTKVTLQVTTRALTIDALGWRLSR